MFSSATLLAPARISDAHHHIRGPNMTTRRSFLMQAAAAGLGAAISVKATSLVQGVAPARRTRGVVQTVQGPIDASKLGFTLPHEHLFASSSGFWQLWPEFFGGRANFIAKVVDKLKVAKDEGVNTIVDLTTADLGRDIRLMEEISRKSGMQIIATTGHWLYPNLSMSSRTVEELTEFFVKEIERGIEGTDIKAGVIKVATDQEGVTPFIEKALRAAARTSKATGTPIETHTLAAKRQGEKQAEIFEAEGLSPAMVSIGHSDYSTEMDYLTGLIKRGYTIGMDHMSRGVTPPAQGAEGSSPNFWQTKVDRIKSLVDAGFANKLFLSNDWLFADSLAPTGAYSDTLNKLNPDGMLFLTRKVIPRLKQLGVPDQTIRTMTVENPRRFFGGV
jgi:phosphotriesterase-related protein